MSASTSHATTGTHVRLTRRGRLLLLVALVAVLFAAFSLGRAASQAASPVPASPAPWSVSGTSSGSGASSLSGAAVVAPVAEQVTVQPGESLWSVALRIAPDHDPREVVAQMRRLNDLSTPEVQPGQQLLLPVAA